MDGQQAGDLLDDDFPSQFDGTVAVVRPLSLCLKPAGFLTDGQTDRREVEGDSRPEGTKHHLIKSGLHGDGSHCETLTDGGQTFFCRLSSTFYSEYCGLHIICSFIPTFPLQSRLKIIKVHPLRTMKGTCEISSVLSVCLRDKTKKE